MFTSISDFLQTWEKEAQATQRCMDVLTDESLKQAVTEHDRTLGRIAWHIVVTIPEMLSKTGLSLESIDEHAPVPDSAQEIARQYNIASEALQRSVKEKWKDETLLEERSLYGQRWTVGTTLYVLINHQIHHRGQMTVLMRQAGLKVPGICGPSREEWSQFGMTAPEV